MAQISYSTAGFNDRDIVPALRAIAAAGFSQAEISSQPPHMSSPLHGNDLKLFQELLKVCGVGASTVHAPMREKCSWCSRGELAPREVGVIGDYLRFAADIGAVGLVIHPVPNPISSPMRNDRS